MKKIKLYLFSLCTGISITSFAQYSPSGACCQGIQCGELDSISCVTFPVGGRFQGRGTHCTPNLCGSSSGGGACYICGVSSVTVPSLNAVYTESNHSVQVSWRLDSTIDKQGFFVERSRNGENFNDIGYLDMSSNDSLTFTDINPYQIGYYRLSFAKNGRSAYSQTISVVAINSGEMIIKPNPAVGKVQVLLNNMQLYNTSVSILDFSGRLVLSRNLSNGELELDISNLPQGVFFVRVLQNGKVYTSKLEKN